MLRPDEIADASALIKACGGSPGDPRCDEGRDSVVPPPRREDPHSRGELDARDLVPDCDAELHLDAFGKPCSKQNCLWFHGESDNDESEC